MNTWRIASVGVASGLKFVSYLSNPQPGHISGGSGRGAAGLGARAAQGRAGQGEASGLLPRPWGRFSFSAADQWPDVWLSL